MKTGHYLEYLLFKGTYRLLSTLPYPVLRAIMKCASRLAHFSGIRKRVVETNIRALLGPGTSDTDVRKISRDCYLEMGRSLAEIIKPEKLIKDVDDTFQLEGKELLDRAIDSGESLLVLTAHIGNFLAAGYMMCKLGYRFTFVAKELENRLTGQEIRKIYERYGNRAIMIRGFRNDPLGGFKIYKSLKKRDIVIILNDQDAGPEGYESRFLGHRTFIPSGPAQFAYSAGARVMTAFVTRSGGKIRIEVQPHIKYGQAASEEEASRLILDEYTRRLEEKVKEHPHQYFWFHKKWKSNPEISAGYGRTRK